MVDVQTATKEPRLAAFEVMTFDPLEVYARHVEGKTVVYLDTNMWIALSDERTDEARTCRETCVRLAQEGSVIFPVSTASVSELVEHPKLERRVAQSRLMDQLSSGICFRSAPFVHQVEVDHLFEHLAFESDACPDRKTMFTSMPDYLGDGFIKFPAGWTPSMVQKFAEFSKSFEFRSIERIVGCLPVTEMRARHLAGQDRYVKETIAQDERRRAHFGKLERTLFENEERVFHAKRSVLPRFSARMKRILMDEPERMNVARRRFAQLGEGGGRRLAKYFERMPALETIVRLQAARCMNPSRRPQKQDFWDSEHAMVAPAYADVFATCDGGLADLLRRGCRGIVRSKVVQGLAKLQEHLDQMI